MVVPWDVGTWVCSAACVGRCDQALQSQSWTSTKFSPCFQPAVALRSVFRNGKSHSPTWAGLGWIQLWMSNLEPFFGGWSSGVYFQVFCHLWAPVLCPFAHLGPGFVWIFVAILAIPHQVLRQRLVLLRCLDQAGDPGPFRMWQGYIGSLAEQQRADASPATSFSPVFFPFQQFLQWNWGELTLVLGHQGTPQVLRPCSN